MTYLELCKELRINSLFGVIKSDIQQHFHEYRLFKLLDLVFQIRENELYNQGIQVLHDAKFSQLVTHKNEVVDIEDIATFRNLIKQHSIFKEKHKTEVSYTYINILIRDYCYSHHKEKPA